MKNLRPSVHGLRLITGLLLLLAPALLFARVTLLHSGPRTFTNPARVTAAPGASASPTESAVTSAALADTFAITKSVVAGGGGSSTGGGFTLTGTIGQSVAGLSSAGNFSLNSGFVGSKISTTTTITAHTPASSSCTQTVTVFYSVVANLQGAGTLTGDVNVSDGFNSCTGTVAAGQCSLTLSTLGNRTLTANYVGDSNYANSTSTAVTHTVSDTQAPTIICPANQVGVVSNGTLAVSWPTPSATDNCATPTVVCNPTSGSAFPLGTTTVTCTASDAASPANTAQCSFTVTVRAPRAAVTNLKTQVQALVPATLSQTQANSLIGYLEMASTYLEQGNNSAACAQLGNFVAQCNQLTPPLNTAQRDSLISYANKIRNAIGTCGSFPTAKRVGVFAAQRGEFYLKRQLMTGLPDQVERYGAPGDLPVAGDWDGKGVDTVGIFRQGVFHLRPARLAEADGNPTGEEITVEFGQPGDLPVVGDWDGDGITTIGVFRAGQFLLRNSNKPGPPDLVINFGEAGDLPLAGDWDGDGQVTIGVYNPTKGLFRMSNTFKDVLADIEVQWGGPGYLPIVGDWDGDGITTLGLYSARGEFLLRNSNVAGPPELVLTLGLWGGLPVAGAWSGKP